MAGKDSRISMGKRGVKMDVDKLKQRIQKLNDQYNKDFEEEDSMANDLLDQLEAINTLKGRLIRALEEQNRELMNALDEAIIDLSTADISINDRIETVKRLTKVIGKAKEIWQ